MSPFFKGGLKNEDLFKDEFLAFLWGKDESFWLPAFPRPGGSIPPIHNQPKYRVFILKIRDLPYLFIPDI